MSAARRRLSSSAASSNLTHDSSFDHDVAQVLALIEDGQSIPRLPFAVRHSYLLEDAKRVVAELFPEWPSECLFFDQCKDGITNKLMRCRYIPNEELQKKGDFEQVVLIRAYGKKSEILIDRTRELVNVVCLSRLGLSPPLHGRFQNGFAYGYIEGDPFTVADMSDPHKSMLVARKLAVWHRVQIAGEAQPALFPTLKRWLSGVPSQYHKPETQSKFNSHFSIEQLSKELNLLETRLSSLQSPVVFCHNDLLSGNIIYEPLRDDVSFIDYEYGNYGFRGFDIGNHFCEYAGFDCDYSKYPGKAHQMVWLRNYLETWHHPIHVTDEQVEALYKEVNLFALAAHFYWGLWALVQAQFSDIDFDYMSYAVLRFNEYFKRSQHSFA